MWVGIRIHIVTSWLVGATTELRKELVKPNQLTIPLKLQLVALKKAVKRSSCLTTKEPIGEREWQCFL